MGERLGIVAEVSRVAGVDLLGVEPERAGELDERGEPVGGFVDSSGLGEGLDEPEGTRQERPSVPGSPSRPGG